MTPEIDPSNPKQTPAVLREVQIGQRTMTAADAVLGYLEAEGTDKAFVYSGTSNNPLITSPNRGRIQFFRPAHEQGAGYAAEGYARMSGKVGVVITIGGPGLTDLITSLANAKKDSTSLIAVIGSGHSKYIGLDTYQNVDVPELTKVVVKQAFRIRKPGATTEVMQEAFYCTRSGRPGPVVVEIPEDIQLAKDTFKPFYPDTAPIYPVNTPMDAWQFNHAADILNHSQKPVILVGNGLLMSPNAPRFLDELARKTDSYVVYTLHGKSGFPDTHHLNAGMIGVRGRDIANQIIDNADCILVVGARRDEKATRGLGERFARQATLIQIDTAPEQCDQTRSAQLSIAANAAFALEEILKRTIWKKNTAWRAMFDEEIQQAKTTVGSSSPDSQLMPDEVIDILSKVTRGKAVVVSDSGQSKFVAVERYLAEDPKSFFASGGLGAMGFGLPAAMGVKIAAPDRDVFALMGDGAGLRVLPLFGTERAYQIPTCSIVMNNKAFGSVQITQEKSGDGRICETDQTDHNPDFLAAGQAFGIQGIRVTRAEEVEPALLQAQQITRSGKPFIVEACVGILRA
ncbi:thiamine pyrophosphate-binding protein [Candidatus Daviesbacteria bacterium]|nr:thiamine pyrophosphate-binding protein [Candidatus Daviesbacteria bacterium]